MGIGKDKVALLLKGSHSINECAFEDKVNYLYIQYKKKSEILTHESLFVMYFWGFALLRPVLQQYSDYSTLILFNYTLTLLVISIAKLLLSQIRVRRSYILLVGVFFVLLCDFLFRSNSYTTKYIYEFTIYGAIPVHLLSQVKDTKKLLNIFSVVSLIIFLLYCTDPLNGYLVFGDYMSFGFNFALPAYFGLYIGRKFYGYKWMLPFEILCLIEIILFANRSVILSIILFWLAIELFYIRRSLKNSVKIIIAILCASVVFAFLQDILSWAISLLGRYGLYSFSLRRIQLYLFEANWSGLFSGRLEIWTLAKNMIKDNILIGSGTGAFQAKYVAYSHNLYYDLMIQYGLIGLAIFFSLTINSFSKIFKHREYTKLIGLVFFCMWFPKLFFSIYIFKDIGIWCFLAFGFLSFEKNRQLNKSLDDYDLLEENNIRIDKKFVLIK